MAPGQERYLPHEAWHVVQQVHGRVRPTFQIKGMSANDDLGLEQEADMMGSKMMQEKGIMHNLKSYPAQFGNSNTVQMNCGHCRHRFPPDKENLLKRVLRRQHQGQHQAEREYYAREYPVEKMARMWEENYFELIKSDPEAAYGPDHPSVNAGIKLSNYGGIKLSIST